METNNLKQYSKIGLIACQKGLLLIFFLFFLTACLNFISFEKEQTKTNANKTEISSKNKSSKIKTKNKTKTVVALKKEKAKPPLRKVSNKQSSNSKKTATETFCSKTGYSKNKEKIKKAIKKGWKKTQSGSFGRGFANKTEYLKWVKNNKALFTQIKTDCDKYNQCTKTKNNKCINIKRRVKKWTSIVKNFYSKAKKVSIQQPAELCSAPPDTNDNSLCFNRLSAQIAKTCSSADCKDLSQCWNSVAKMDHVINQSASSCKFTDQPLVSCEGYIQAINRRQSLFKECSSLLKRARLRPQIHL